MFTLINVNIEVCIHVYICDKNRLFLIFATMNLFVEEKLLSYFSWLRLTLTLNARNRIPVRVIMKTFASGRNERIVYQSLKDLNLPHGKVCFKLFFCLL